MIFAPAEMLLSLKLFEMIQFFQRIDFGTFSLWGDKTGIYLGGLYNMIWTPPFRTPNMTYEKPVSWFASWASIVFLGVTKI